MRKKIQLKNRGLAPLLIAAGIGAIAVIGGATFGKPILDAAGQGILNGMLHFLDFVLPLVRYVFLWLGGISANAINTFVLMNPFDSATLSPFLWETFKNIAYVVIIFFSLYAGFMWIIGRDSAAKPMIFKLLIIALLINFSFFIAKELFFVSHVITKSLACSFGQNEKVQSGGEPCSQVGTAIYTGLLMFGDNNLVAGIKGDVEKLSSAESSSRLSQLIFAHLVAFVLFFIFTSIMMILAGMFVGRFLMISFLVGILPLAIISWASPKNSGNWEEWSKRYLTWLTNIPTLLLFILVGFSIVGVGLGDNFRDKLQANVDTRILMGGGVRDSVDPNAVKGYAGLIRFFFLVGYYAFAIVYAQKVGGKAAKFGHDFAVGSYLALGGAVRGAATKGVFKPTRNLLGAGLEDIGRRIEQSNPAFLGIATRGMGTKMREAGKGMLAQKRERIEKDASQYVEANKGDPQKLGQYLKNARGEQRRVIAKVIGEKLQRHEELQAVVDHLDESELGDFLSDERVRKALGTRTGIGKFSSAVRKGTPEGLEDAAKIMSQGNLAQEGLSRWRKIFIASGGTQEDWGTVVSLAAERAGAGSDRNRTKIRLWSQNLGQNLSVLRETGMMQDDNIRNDMRTSPAMNTLTGVERFNPAAQGIVNAIRNAILQPNPPFISMEQIIQTATQQTNAQFPANGDDRTRQTRSRIFGALAMLQGSQYTQFLRERDLIDTPFQPGEARGGPGRSDIVGDDEGDGGGGRRGGGPGRDTVNDTD